jgi:carboxypeptidase family protein
MIGLVVLAGVAVFLVAHFAAPDLPGAGSPQERSGGAVRDPNAGGDAVVRDGPLRLVPGGVVGVVRRGSRPAAARIEVRRLHRKDFELESELLEPPSFGPPVGTATAGRDGRFEVIGLDPGTYEVLARADDSARASAIVTIRLVGQRVEANVALPERGVTLRGRARWSDGRPYAGDLAIVPWLLEDEEPDYAPVMGTASRVRTGEHGRFEASGLAPGRVSISALLPGPIRVFGLGLRVPREDEVVFTVDAGFLRAQGRVVDALDGRPIPSATIVAKTGDDDYWDLLLTRTVSDDAGRFSVTTNRWSSDVLVTASGYGTYRGVLGPLDQEAVFQLHGQASIRGRIVAADDGRPVPGVPVEAMPETPYGGVSLGKVPDRTVSDADGRYVLPDLPAGEIAVFAAGGGWVARALRDDHGGGNRPNVVRLDAGETVEMDFRVDPAVVVEGRVVDEAGAGMAGVEVRVEESPCRAVTDAGGRFRMDALAAETAHTFVAHPPGRAETRAGPYLAIEGEPLRVEIRIPEPRWIEVLVVEDGVGRRVSGATVAVTDYGGRKPHRGTPIGEWRTDAAGRALVGPLPSAELRLSAWHDDYLDSHECDVPAEAGVGEPHRIEVALIRGLTISGRVVRPDGMPVRCGSWDIERLDIEGWAEGWIDGGSIQPDDEGRFRISGLTAGEYSISVMAGDESEFEGYCTVSAGAGDLRIEVAETPPEEERGSGTEISIEISIVSDRPVIAGRVECLKFVNPARGRVSRVGRDQALSPDGTVRFSWPSRILRPETRFWFAVHGCRDATGSPLGAAVVGPVSRGEPQLTVRLGPGMTIEGVVRDPDGRPVHGARIEAVPLYPEMPPLRKDVDVSLHDETLTAADGSYRLTGLRDGPYEVRCVASVAHLPVAPLRTSGGARDADFELRAAAQPLLTILDTDGRPVVGALVAVMIDNKALDQGRSDARGRVRLGRVDPEIPHVLIVIGPAARQDLKKIGIDPWSPKDGTIRLPAARIIRGVVRDRAGNAVGSAWVHLGGTGKRLDVWCDDDGSFRFTDIPPGTATLRALPDGLDPYSSPPVVVEGAADDVVLVVPTGGSLDIRVASWPLGLDVRAALHIEGSDDVVFDCVDARGRISLPWVPFGRTFTLVIGPIGKPASWVLERGLVPGEKVVSLARGAPIRGRIVLPDDCGDLEVGDFELVIEELNIVEFHEVEECEIEDDGSFVIPGLPRGVWTVVCRARIYGDLYTDRATVEAGGTVTLRPKKE